MNYEFLKAVPQMDKLHTACCDAERFIGTEPNYAVAAARRSIEYMVKLLYSSSVSPYIEGLSVFDMLSDPALQKYLDDPQLISEIHSIRKCGNRAVHEGTVSPEEAEDVLRLLHHVIGESCMFLGLIDGYPDPDICFIGFFMMNKAYQGRQIGSGIIREVSEYLRSLGYQAVRLAIDKGNPQSSHFWKKNGFPVIKEVDRNGWTVLVAEQTL